jgi:pectate lyase
MFIFSLIFSLLLSCSADQDVFNDAIEKDIIQNAEEEPVSDSNNPDIVINDEVSSELKAFPTAEGYGKFSTGGRGGDVYRVTNLNDSGAGSFRDACEAAGPRTVIFDIDGEIALNSPVNITNDNITIAPQTAPGDGVVITLKGLDEPVLQIDASDVIIRYLRIRHSLEYVGSSSGADGIYIASGSNIIIDHCSVTWASDEQISITEYTDTPIRNVTVQNCIIGEGFTGSSKGSLATGDLDGITYYRNYFVHSNLRNPQISSDWNYPLGNRLAEVINNVVYHYKYAFSMYNNQGPGEYWVNYIGNLHTQPDGSSSSRRAASIYNNYDWEQSGNTSREFKLYVLDNKDSFRKLDNEDEWAITQGEDGVENVDILGARNRQSLTPFPTQIVNDNIQLTPAYLVWDEIGSTVGASLPMRDEVDTYLVNDFNEGNHRDSAYVSHSLPIMTQGTPKVDSDGDGIPDDFEIAMGSNPNIANNNDDLDGDGYTNLEEYINNN